MRVDPDPERYSEATLSEFRQHHEEVGYNFTNQLLLGRVPGLVEAVGDLGAVALAPGRVGSELKWLIGHISSRVAGCQFCSVQSADSAAVRHLVALEKLEAVWEFDRSPLFNSAERAALQLAVAASAVPNAVTDAHFEELRRHFDDDQILELVAALALFAFANRWTDTLGLPPDEAAVLRVGTLRDLKA
jgi:alkylhydroperoxidase family enzyme